MDRRPLAVLLALGAFGAFPSGVLADSPSTLFAAAPTGSLSDKPVAVAAAGSAGTLSDTPKAPKVSKSSGSSSVGTTATASALPFTGSDPRITLLLGVAAVLLGAGLRMRTGDARDY